MHVDAVAGRVGLAPQEPIVVSDSVVTAAALVSRVITGVAFEYGAAVYHGALDALFSYGDVYSVVASAVNTMTSEGDSGLMFSRVLWSDGAAEDVGYAPAIGVEEMAVSVGSSGVSTTAPTATESFWRVGVAKIITRKFGI